MEDRGDDPQAAECNNEANQTTPAPDSNDHMAPKLEDAVPQFETMNATYHFTLTGYSLARGSGVGKHISSGTFAVGGHEWAIYFYPDGKYKEDHSLYVSVFIALVSEAFDVQALFEITLLDQSGKGKHKSHSHFDGHLKSPYTLKYQGCMWGYRRFYRREMLEQSGFLKYDTLMFTGRVGVLLSSTKPTKLNTTPASPPSPLDPQRSRNIDQGDSSQQSLKTEEGTQSTGSQSDDAFEKLKALRIEDELARYYHKLNRDRSPVSVDNHSESQQGPPVN